MNNNWQSIKLDKCVFIDKYSLSEKTSIEKSFYYIDLSAVSPNCINIPKEKINFGSSPSRARRIIHNGDILFATVRPYLMNYALINFDASEYIASTGFAVLSAKEGFDIKYIYQYLFSNFLQKQINNLLLGSNYPALNNKDVKTLTIFIPKTLSEQHRIVAVLETWDKAISLTKRLIEQKEIQKKHLIFSFVLKAQNTREYIVKDVFNLTRGRVISESYIKENTGIYPVYSSQTTNDGILGYISSYDFNGEYLTWTTDGANAGKVFYRNGKFNCTNVCGLAIPKIAIDLKYVSAYLNLITKRYVSYVGNPKLMNNVFGTMVFKVPNYTYQKNISAVLSAADKEISLLKEKLAKLQQQKKGLMQILLTGKVRLGEQI